MNIRNHLITIIGTIIGTAILGPSGAILGSLSGGFINEIIPEIKDFLKTLLEEMAASNVTDIIKKTVEHINKEDVTLINHDLQLAYRDAVREAIIDIGGVACFPKQWKNTRGVIPDDVIYTLSTGHELWQKNDPLAEQVEEVLNAFVDAIDTQKILPNVPSANIKVESADYLLMQMTLENIQDTFFQQIVHPFLSQYSTLLIERPDFEKHLRRHLFSRTMVHLGEFLKQRTPAWRAYNRLIVDSMRDSLAQISGEQADLSAKIDAFFNFSNKDITTWANGIADLISSLGELEKRTDETLDNLIKCTTIKNKAILKSLHKIISSSKRIEGKLDLALVELSDIKLMMAELKMPSSTRFPHPNISPYRGLQFFDEEDAGVFFGREQLIQDLIERVRISRTVFITGPSGSGKSSLLRAGLIHTLKKGSNKTLHSEHWVFSTLNPGRDPLEALALALSRLKTPELGTYFRQNIEKTSALNDCIEAVLCDRRDQRMVFLIDQFEEIFSPDIEEHKRMAFLKLIIHAATVEGGRTIFLFCMRSDFIRHVAAYPQLNQLLNQQFVQVGAMCNEELLRAIVMPALSTGIRIEADLVAQIMHDMHGEPGSLPLMQFALKDLFDAEKERGTVKNLTLKGYLARGGLQKALECHADHVFTQFNDAEMKLASLIFTKVVNISENQLNVRRTAFMHELITEETAPEPVRNIVQKLADARLITTDEKGGIETITLAHDILLDSWPWLKKLVNDNREVIALQNEIANDAGIWDSHRRDASYLYSGLKLANMLNQMKGKKIFLSELASEFIRTARKKQQRMRMASIVGIILTLTTLSIALVIYKIQAEDNRILANNARISANEASTLAVNARMQADEARVQANEARLQADEARRQTKIAISRQLAAQALYMHIKQGPDLMIGVLLSIRAMQLDPSASASQVLSENLLAYPTARMDHEGFVTSVIFSPDGRYVASGSDDHTVRVWEATTGVEIARMTHEDSVTSVAFSPDGRYVASGSYDYTVRIWEAATGQQIARMEHDGFVESVAFSPDGKYVVSGSEDHTARVWKATTGVEIARMTHEDTVRSVAFSPDGKSVASGSWDNTIRVWEAATGVEIIRIKNEDLVTSVAFSPDGEYVASGSMLSARVWRITSGKEIAHMTHMTTVVSVAFSPDGRYVASGSDDYTVRVWEATTGVEIARMTHEDSVTSVAFSPDGKSVVSGSWDHTARVWNIANSVKIARMAHGASVTSVAFSPDGRYVASGSIDCTVRVWEAATGVEIIRMTHERPVESVAFSPDGRYVASGSWDHTVRVWEVATGVEIARMTHEDSVWSVAFSPDGKFVASGSGDKTVRIWEAATGKKIVQMMHESSVSSVTFSPDGRFVASGSYDYTVRIWEAATGQQIARMEHDGFVESVAFSPNGRFVASGSHDRTVRVWEATTGKEIEKIKVESWVISVNFNPDGKYLISGSNSGIVRIWNTDTDVEIGRMMHKGTVDMVIFSPNNKLIVTVGGDDTVWIWKWQSKDLIEDACLRVTRNMTRSEWQQYMGAESYQAICPNLPIENE